jgi:transcriptional regulator with XRE-family HTH domain
MHGHSSLSNRLKDLRGERQLSQVEVSEAVGMSRSYLAGIERGHALPGRETLVALANYYDVSLDWLTSGEGDRRPARALNEEEALILYAFRRLPPEEAKAHLQLLLSRVDKVRN